AAGGAPGKEPAPCLAEPPDGRRVEGKLSGPAPDSIGSEKFHRRRGRGVASGKGVAVIVERMRTATVTTCPSFTRTPGASGRTVAGTERLAERSSMEIGSVEIWVIGPMS